jgi:ABC-type glutathione transport system ATPase component
MIDASLRMNIVNLFLSLKERYHTSFPYITHDLATAYYISDAIAIMYRGCIVEFGEARTILTSPQHLNNGQRRRHHVVGTLGVFDRRGHELAEPYYARQC